MYYSFQLKSVRDKVNGTVNMEAQEPKEGYVVITDALGLDKYLIETDESSSNDIVDKETMERGGIDGDLPSPCAPNSLRE